MTTIAINRDAIASDLQFTYGGSTKMRGSSKILQVPPETCRAVFGCSGAYVGFAGSANSWTNAISWLLDPSTRPPKMREIEFLMLNDKHEMFYAQSLNNWQQIYDKHFAIGSGMQYAIAAMTLGKTPIEACRVASKHDPMTGMGFKSYSFK